jgi:hypothetical protein
MARHDGFCRYCARPISGREQPTLSSTTVLLAGLPRMLEDMLSSLLEPHPDIHVVRGEARDRDLISAAAAAGAQVVVVTRRDPANLAEVDPYLALAATVSIVALEPDGASACVHALRSETARLEDVSAEQILHALAPSHPIGRA